MRYTDLTNDELDAMVEMSKLLSKGQITVSRYLRFFNELQRLVLQRKQLVA